MNKLYSLLAAIDPNDVQNVPQLDAADAIANILNLVYFIAGTVAVITIIVAGFMMTVQGNNPEKIRQRKNAITFAVIGLAIVLLAFAITQFLAGRF